MRSGRMSTAHPTLRRAPWSDAVAPDAAPRLPPCTTGGASARGSARRRAPRSEWWPRVHCRCDELRTPLIRLSPTCCVSVVKRECDAAVARLSNVATLVRGRADTIDRAGDPRVSLAASRLCFSRCASRTASGRGARNCRSGRIREPARRRHRLPNSDRKPEAALASTRLVG